MKDKLDSTNSSLKIEFQFYKWAIQLLKKERIPFLIGGAFAMSHFTPIHRFTKDMDIFIERHNRDRVIKLFAGRARTERTHPHWLLKVFNDEGLYMDVIFNSGNGVCQVDRRWFEFAPTGRLWGLSVPFSPLEEMIWVKSFIMERNRFDGADIAHLLYFRAADIDWRRLIERFEKHWRLLLLHLVLFGFVYPDKRDAIPRWVLKDLSKRLCDDRSETDPAQKICFGALLSGVEYRRDLLQEGYLDPRLFPIGNMSSQQIDAWEKNLLGAALTEEP